ncbi:MAG: VOC family protein [Solirubrobacteraceae bacterium]|nr:VOC family protein [Solirubrobacteraceae bacterium]
MPDPEQPRRMAIRGLHHLTLISADMDATTAFYRDLLGLALVQEAISDDDPEARHHWFDTGGGQRISFLEYPTMEKGVVGTGSTHHIALAVDSPEELDVWRDYLTQHGVESSQIFERNGFRSLYLRDPDGHILELATRVGAVAVPPSAPPA